MSRSPRSRDAAALNFRLGQLCRTKQNLLDLHRATYSEEYPHSILYEVRDTSKRSVSIMVDILNMEIQDLKKLIKDRAAETQRRKKEKKDD